MSIPAITYFEKRKKTKGDRRDRTEYNRKPMEHPLFGREGKKFKFIKIK